MLTQCPKCGASSTLDRPFIRNGEAVVSCVSCGTIWNPLADETGVAPGLQAVSAVPVRFAPGSEISDAVVIEHIGPAFAKLPPHRRKQEAEKGAKERNYLGVAGLIFGVVVMLAAAGAPLFSAVPGLASISGMPDSADLLAFRDVRTQTLFRGSASTLFVQGQVVNSSMVDVPLPPIRVTLRSVDGKPVTSWLVEPETQAVTAGGSVGFRSGFASPPDGATEVSLSLDTDARQVVGMR